MKIIDLPPCRRRMVHSEVIFCRVPHKQKGMSDIDYISLVRANPKHQVTYDDCLQCRRVITIPSQTPVVPSPEPPMITPDGILIYSQKGWEPPPCPPEYHRKSKDFNSPDAWVFEPNQPICKHLELVPTKRGSCSCIRVTRRCKFINSFIGPKTCLICPKKEVSDGAG